MNVFAAGLYQKENTPEGKVTANIKSTLILF